MIPISLMVPTNDPERFFHRVGATMLPFAQIVLYVQPPWTPADTRTARRRFAPSAVYAIEGPALPRECISHIEWNLCMLDRCTCDLVMRVDTDTLFRKTGSMLYPRCSRERIEDAASYLHKQTRCMAIMQLGYLGGSVAKEAIVPSLNGLIAVDRGLIFRRRPSSFYHARGIRNQIGGMEESLLVFPLLEQSETFYARQFNVPTKIQRDSPRGMLATGKRKWSFDAATQLIRQRYNDPTWTHEARRLPKGLCHARNAAQLYP